ncbi:hypothetical protein ACA910_021402 [Epithemia clementina (nom. ined.)]
MLSFSAILMEGFTVLQAPADVDLVLQDVAFHGHDKQKGQSNAAIKNKYSSKHTAKRPVRVVYGILSHDMTAEEKERRQIVRDTFLSYYFLKNHQAHGQDNSYSESRHSDKNHWICSFNDLQTGKVEKPEQCRLAYVFVIGANPDGSTLLLNHNESYPLTIPKNSSITTQEPDAVYLNIQENGNFGKTPTWFRYASTTLEERGWANDWDFIFKADSDNLLYPSKLFDFLDRSSPLERPVRNAYGGSVIGMKRCDHTTDPKCRLPERSSKYHYMQGGCYFVSLDVAAFISSPSTVDLQNLTTFPHEDIMTGLSVSLYPGKIRMINDKRIRKSEDNYRVHPIKKINRFMRLWKNYVSEERKQTIPQSMVQRSE